ncbi:MAG: HigA family addiction module antidote protein [Devosiaceae bacterium]|nr:HigA family addiction module antidote protein [Devosiaceae bacterium MH13]
MQKHHSLRPIHPGEILAEDVLPATGLSKTAFAARLGVSRQTLHDVLACRQPVTANMAVRLGKLLGNGPVLWANMQTAYDLAKAAQSIDLSTIEPLDAA